MPDVISPIFVGGLHRSGTTLLARLITRHPLVTGLVNTSVPEDEGQFLQHVYPDDRQMATTPGYKRGLIYKWGYHPQAHLTERDAALHQGAADSLIADWRPYFGKPEAPNFVEKSPGNIARTRFLQAIFPAARFLGITRNPAVQALAIRKWLPLWMQVGLGLEAVVGHWIRVMELFETDEPFLERVKVVRYERLLSSPEAVMGSVWSFLGLPSYSVGENSVRDENAKYVEYWDLMARGVKSLGHVEPLNPIVRPLSVVPRALERLVVPLVGPITVRSIQEEYADAVAHFGYSLGDLELSTEWPLPLQPGSRGALAASPPLELPDKLSETGRADKRSGTGCGESGSSELRWGR